MKIINLLVLIPIIGLTLASSAYAGSSIHDGAHSPGYYWGIKKIGTGIFEFYASSYAEQYQRINVTCVITHDNNTYLNITHVGPDKMYNPTLNGANYGEFNNHLPVGANNFSFGMIAYKSNVNTYRFTMPCWKGATCSYPYDFNVSCIVKAVN